MAPVEVIPVRSCQILRASSLLVDESLKTVVKGAFGVHFRWGCSEGAAAFSTYIFYITFSS